MRCTPPQPPRLPDLDEGLVEQRFEPMPFTPNIRIEERSLGRNHRRHRVISGLGVLHVTA